MILNYSKKIKNVQMFQSPELLFILFFYHIICHWVRLYLFFLFSFSFGYLPLLTDMDTNIVQVFKLLVHAQFQLFIFRGTNLMYKKYKKVPTKRTILSHLILEDLNWSYTGTLVSNKTVQEKSSSFSLFTLLLHR